MIFMEIPGNDVLYFVQQDVCYHECDMEVTTIIYFLFVYCDFAYCHTATSTTLKCTVIQHYFEVNL